MNLRRVQGPECPKCGCADAEVIQRSERWGHVYERRRCLYCKHRWFVTVEPKAVSDERSAEAESNGGADKIVVYRPVTCPECGSTHCPVTSTRRPHRHHKCLACGWCFKSVEQDA